MAELLQAPMVNHEMTSTTFDLPGYRAVRSLGVVRGIVVRSPKFLKQFTASFSVLFGGEISQYVQVAEESRHQALVRMLQHAGEMGANAARVMRVTEYFHP